MEADFSGYATKASLRCSDGLTIVPGAFKGNHGKQVPLVWQHNYDSPDNILGHAILEDRNGSVYTKAYFNDSPMAQQAKELVRHKDINHLSIQANRLKKRGQDVLHGNINEVSLVIAGANPGALIDFTTLDHNDEDGTDSGEATIYTGLPFDEISHAEEEKETGVSAEKDDDDLTIDEVIASMNENQKNVLAFLVNEASDEASASHSDTDEEEGSSMSHNVFESQNEDKIEGNTLTHDQMKTIFDDAKRGGSLKDAVLAHAADYGITNIDVLFPDAKTQQAAPSFIKRRTEWVAGVLDGTHHSPFSRVKTVTADITEDSARAKGYITGTLKKEEFFSLAQRAVTPTTIYKKQKLDRDDIMDITDFDVVSWIRAEMRVMLNEEIARAILIGDGRDILDPDKINEGNIIPIYKDAPLYAHRVIVDNYVPSGGSYTPEVLIEAALRSRKVFEGTGRPNFYTSADVITDILLDKDEMGRRLYPTEADVASALRVGSLMEIPQFETQTRTVGEGASAKTYQLLGIMVNLKDYTVGADKGGQISAFDDFDIDYNQYKYLLETRISGALTAIKSAIIFEKEITAP